MQVMSSQPPIEDVKCSPLSKLMSASPTVSKAMPRRQWEKLGCNRSHSEISTMDSAQRKVGRETGWISLTNSDSALPLSSTSQPEAPRGPSLPSSKTSLSSAPREYITSTPPAVPLRTTSSPLRRTRDMETSQVSHTSSAGPKPAPRRFLGKSWVLDKISKWSRLSGEILRQLIVTEDDMCNSSVEQSTCCLMVMGNHGSGKTSIIRQIVGSCHLNSYHNDGLNEAVSEQLTSSHGYQLLTECAFAYHFCSLDYLESLSLPRFILSLRDQVCDRADAIGNYYHAALTDRDSDLLDLFASESLCTNPDEAFRRGILDVLHSVDAAGVQESLEVADGVHRLLIYVDSIDDSWLFEEGFQPTANTSADISCRHKARGSISVQGISNDMYHCSLNSPSKEECIRRRPSRSIGELLASNLPYFPSWLGLVCTARPQSKSTLSRLFPCSHRVCIDDIQLLTVTAELEKYIHYRINEDSQLTALFQDGNSGESTLRALALKSNACFVYLETVLDAVSEGWLATHQIAGIPATLNGLFLWLCQKFFPPLEQDSMEHLPPTLFRLARPLLNILLASPKPVTETTMCAAFRTQALDPVQFNPLQCLFSLRYFIRMAPSEFLAYQPRQWVDSLPADSAITEPVLVFVHSSLREWLTDVKYCSPLYLCSKMEGHNILALTAINQITPYPKLEPASIWGILYQFSRSSLASSKIEPREILEYLLQNGVDLSQVTEVQLDDWIFTTHPLLLECIRGDKTLEHRLLAALHLQLSTVPELTLDIIHSNGQHSDYQRSATSLDGVAVPLADNQENAAGRVCAAAYQGKLEEIRSLLQSGNVNPELADASGSTPLVLAARRGHTDVVRELLLFGVRLDHVDMDGWSALRSAAWGGHLDVVDLLLDAGANVNLTGPDQRTALRAAAWAGHVDVVRCLLAALAEVDRADAEERTPLIAAAYMGHASIVEILAEAGANLNHADQDGRTALCVAAVCVPPSSAHLDVVTRLLDNGADPNIADGEGVTPLLGSASTGRRRVCEICLEADADVDQTDR